MIGAVATTPGTRMAGAFMKCSRVLLTSPAPDAANTSATVSLQGKVLDPFLRTCAIRFQLDRTAVFTGADLQTSSNVNGKGWADVALSWASAAIANGTWYYRGRAESVLIGSGPNAGPGRYTTAIRFIQEGGEGIPRSLYLYVNKGVQSEIAGVGANARALYLYVNKGIQIVAAGFSRSLYLYVNKSMYPGVLVGGLSRSLYLYLSAKDGEVSPYLNHISPVEQYIGGQVDLYGDGFGQHLDATQAATLSVSSTNGGNIAAFVRNGLADEWQSTSGSGAWIRFTWGAAKRIVAIVLEGPLNGTSWGVPRFTFDDATSQDGGPSVPNGSATFRDTQFPVGTLRQVYWLATPKVSTFVEVGIASGGSGTNRGFAEAWIIEEGVPPQAAETSRAVLNLGLPAETAMGIVSWTNRSPNWHPANGGVPPLPAATVTVPSGAVSGLVKVEEST